MAGGGRELLPTNATAKRIAPVREAATQLFGDPTQPSLKGLKDFAYLADSPARSRRVGTAVELILNGMGKKRESRRIAAQAARELRRRSAGSHPIAIGNQ